MPKLYIMSGLAFSGKSTLSKQIAERTGARRFAFDEMWVEKDKTGAIPQGTGGWQYIRTAAQEEILKCLQNGQSAVYDENNPRVEHRKEFIEVAERAGAQAVVIFMDIPFETIQSRRLANLSSQERHDVDDANFDKVLSDLEAPADHENALIFTPATDLEVFLAELT